MLAGPHILSMGGAALLIIIIIIIILLLLVGIITLVFCIQTGLIKLKKTFTNKRKISLPFVPNSSSLFSVTVPINTSFAPSDVLLLLCLLDRFCSLSLSRSPLLLARSLTCYFLLQTYFEIRIFFSFYVCHFCF